MNRSFYLKTKVLIAFGLILSAIAVASVVAYNSYEQLSISVNILSQKDTKIQQIDSILILVGKSENTLQEYNIERSPKTLSQYDSLVSKVRSRVEALKSVSSNQSSQLDSILSLINVKLVSMKEFLILREKRDDYQFYDEALARLEQEINIRKANAKATQEKKINDRAEDKTQVQPPIVTENEEEEKSWFKRIIDRLTNKDEEEDEPLASINSQENKPDEQDTLDLKQEEVSAFSIDSVRSMLLKLKQEQAATELNLDRQELSYLSTNAEVMNSINSLIRSVKNERQVLYQKQSAEARHMLKSSLSRLGIILFIALVSIFLFVYLIFSDIAKSDFLKDQLQRAKLEAEQLARVKEKFLANMSHEIRTPLTAILGFSRLLNETRLDDQQKGYAQAVSSSSSHLLSIVNDILDFSKIEAGHLKFEKTPFDIYHLVEEVCHSMRVQAEEKGLQIIYESEGKELRYVKGDAFRLKQVLYNLISNAIKFTDEGGVIVRLKLRTNQEEIINAQLEVSDTGIGIPADKQAQVFDSFVQSDVSDTRKYGGTGLGLTITKNLVEAQGGEVAIESKIGDGTTFYIALPFSKGSVAALPKSEQINHNTDFSTLRVLAIDDDELNTKLLSVLFERWGIDYRVANSGKEGINMLQESPFDMLMTDLQMPEMDGEQVAQEVRKLGFQLPIIAFTARVTEDLNYFKNKGFDGVLHKPFKEKSLFTILEKYATEHTGPGVLSGLEHSKDLTVVDDNDTPFYSFATIRQFIGEDQDSLLEYLISFVRLLKECRQKLETGLKEGNLYDLGYYAHKLYPNASHLEVLALPSLLRQIENSAKANSSLEEFSKDVEQAIQICYQLEDALRQEKESLEAQVS